VIEAVDEPQSLVEVLLRPRRGRRDRLVVRAEIVEQHGR
jgi:hypothetical protein